ncbi:MAG: hypothetical protein ACRC5M_05575 [Anaeroplasmataceae bacterium]
MDIFTDYGTWLFENDEFIESFRENNHYLVYKVDPIFTYLNYIYAKACDKQPIEAAEEDAFNIGLSYLNFYFSIIFNFLDALYNNELDELFIHADSILFYILVEDFIEDNLLSLEEVDENAVRIFKEIQDDALVCIENKTGISDSIKDKFEELANIYANEYIPIDSMFYELCEDLDLIEEEEFEI